jgi:hypothetical protein
MGLFSISGELLLDTVDINRDLLLDAVNIKIKDGVSYFEIEGPLFDKGSSKQGLKLKDLSLIKEAVNKENSGYQQVKSENIAIEDRQLLLRNFIN